MTKHLLIVAALVLLGSLIIILAPRRDRVVAQLTGTSGGVGTYTVDRPQTLGVGEFRIWWRYD